MKPTYSGKYMICKFDKPFGGSSNLYALRDIHVHKAKRYGKTLRLITPSGTMTCSPSKLMRMSKLIEMYKYNPQQPMYMYQFALTPDKEEVDYEQQEQLIDNSIKERLRERAIELGFYKRAGI
jgi:hypothetical protein